MIIRPILFPPLRRLYRLVTGRAVGFGAVVHAGDYLLDEAGNYMTDAANNKLTG